MNIVFDFGAVLFTWRPGQLLQEAFPALQHDPDQAARLAHQIFGHPDWHDFDRGVLSMDAVIVNTATRLGLPLASLGNMVRRIGEHLTPIPACLVLLAELHARRKAGAGVTGLFFLSNMPEPYARTLQQKYDFLQWFDGGIFSADVQRIKPDLAIYNLLQDRHALVPAQTLFIDDLKANVHAAQSLGWHAIHFESPRQLQEQLELSLQPYSHPHPQTPPPGLASA